VQDEENSLGIIIDQEIKASFFTYKYDLLEATIDEEYLRLASLADIGCMKLSAITSRSVMKDYVDLYFILQKIKLADLLQRAEKKLPTLDRNLILKSLVYFDEIEDEPIMYKHNQNVDFSVIKTFLETEVKKNV